MSNVEPFLYKNIFDGTQAGKDVMLELVQLFHDRASYTKGDTHETAYLEGQRSVIAYILAKAGQSNEVEQFQFLNTTDEE